MNKTTQVRLYPEDQEALLKMMENFNHACNALSIKAFETRTFNWLALQRASYHWLRQEFGLLSAEAVTAIRKVAQSYKYKPKRKSLVRFRLRGAIPVYKHSYKRDGTVRFYGMKIPFKSKDDIYLSGKKQATLVYQNRKFVLYQAYEIDDVEPMEVSDYIGCDLGIVNLLSDSDGIIYSGAEIDDARRKYSHRRRNLQRKGTKPAKRKLRSISGKQARFQRNINHVISKRVVAKATDTLRGIALEDLGNIRERITVRRRQRARHNNWGFAQLRQFITYKAALAGVPVVIVDPRNTSRTCPMCGHVAKSNRPSRDDFKCVSCGFAGSADTVAAWNIRARALGNVPMVAA